MFITTWLMFCWLRCLVKPGHFEKICEKLAAEHLNIDYAYCSFAPGKGSKSGVLAVVRVNDLVKAQRVLGVNGNTVSRTPRRPVRRPAQAW